MIIHPHVREAGPADSEVIRRMLYEAIYLAPDERIPCFSVIDSPELRGYHEHWMKPGDAGIIAEVEHEAVGAAWVRMFSGDAPGYGFAAEDVPELSIALIPEYRGRGIGTMMLNQLFELLSLRDIRRVSLSVDPCNPAVRLYRRFGFQEVQSVEGSLVMIREERLQ